MPDSFRSPHANDSRASERQEAEAKFASTREVVETVTPADLVEQKDYAQHGHKEEGVRIINGRVMLSDRAFSRVPPPRPREVVQEEEPPATKVLTLRHALTHNDDERQLTPDEEADRVLSWHALIKFVHQEGLANPWQAFKNFLGAVNRVNPEYLGGISRETLGLLLNETRAAASAREIRIVEEQMRRWGVLGFHGGGTKSEGARAKSKRAQKGNTHRRDGRRHKKRMRDTALKQLAAA